jgi:hypothetical protein
VRAHILGKESLPSLNDVFPLIRVEKGRRTIMLDVPNTEGSTMMISSSKNPNDAMNVAKMVKTKKKKFSKDNQLCNYCKRTGHIKETCWKLH